MVMDMGLKIKICGITRLADARYCAAAGADYLGFIQHPESPRYIDPAAAKDIIDWVYGPQAVGVFVNRSADDVNAAVERAGFALAQLHGDESPEVCADVSVPVIKAFRIGDDTTPEDVANFFDLYRGVADYFLLDSRADAVFGGSGTAFDWSVAASQPDKERTFLAGGIHAGNVADAVHAVVPFAVDVSSGVESSPGIKEFEKIDAFFDAYNPLRSNGS